MFNRAHSVFLRELLRRAGDIPEISAGEPGEHVDLFYINILVDSLPFHAGINPAVTHDPAAYAALDESSQPGHKLRLGFRLHHLLDNLSHCGSLNQCTDYSSGFALQAGLKVHDAAPEELKEIFQKVEGKSAFYTLHTAVEMAVELCIDGQGINETLDRAAAAFLNKWDTYRPLLRLIPNLSERDLDRSFSGMSERVAANPFVEGVSLEGLTGRFVARYLPSSDTPRMRGLVREFLSLARDRMTVQWPMFLNDAVRAVTQEKPEIVEALRTLVRADREF